MPGQVTFHSQATAAMRRAGWRTLAWETVDARWVRYHIIEAERDGIRRSFEAPTQVEAWKKALALLSPDRDESTPVEPESVRMETRGGSGLFGRAIGAWLG